MVDQGWQVTSRCQACDLTMKTDLEALVKVKGHRFSLWNTSPRCRRLGCNGRVVFSGKPGNHWRTVELRAQCPPGKIPSRRQGCGWL